MSKKNIDIQIKIKHTNNKIENSSKILTSRLWHKQTEKRTETIKRIIDEKYGPYTMYTYKNTQIYKDV